MELVPEAQREPFGSLVTDEYRASVAQVKEITGQELLGGDPTLLRGIELRNPYVDPISYLQVELLKRLRALPEDADEGERAGLEEAVMMSLLGIAAGLRNTG